MVLKSFTYKWDGSEKSNPYHIDNVGFTNINLVVGKNATGKSRLVQSVYSLAKMISMEVSYLYYGTFTVVFSQDNEEDLHYEIEVKNKKVLRELIRSKDSVLLKRDLNGTLIYSEIKKDLISITPPENKLVVHVRRDVAEFPFLEYIANWAENTFGFKFGNITPNSYLIDKETDRLTSIDDIPSILEKLISFNDDFSFSLNKIIDDFNSLGYNISNIEVNTRKNRNLLFIVEDGIKYKIPQYFLSQGMFRSLVLIIFLEYVFITKKASTIIIDDICEGLDYERAVKLGELIFKKYSRQNIQLITTSNDSFLMNSVNLKYWNVLYRSGSVVKSKDYRKNKQLFDEFKFTGLSNFDLLSSDFLLEKK